MATFDEEKQIKKLETLKKEEEEELARILSQKYGLDYVDLSKESISTDALRLIPEATARAAEAAAYDRVGKKVSVAIRTPNSERVVAVIDDLKRRSYEPTLYMASSGSLARAWDHYKDISFAVETQAGLLDISNETISKILASVKTLDDTRVQVKEVLAMKRIYKISRALETMIAGALANDASDIHIEPEEKEVRIRFRLDGVLMELLMMDHETFNLILSRIKLLSGLKLNIKNAPQDGRFSVRIDNKDIEIRTSILPGAYGESIVMRLLDPHTIGLPMEELGLEPALLALLDKELQRPNGMILNTGPTGSGKTTTLYAFMRRVYSPDLKILTIEDPVEYHLDGIVQTQVNKKGYTFATGLRSALRQDPDIIMVGEIRDEEVAETAVHAALTGHLVFSTLHTNSAAGAFPRLVDLGIDPSILGSSVNVAMAQRLVRILDPDHRKEVPIEGKYKDFVDKVIGTFPDKSILPERTDIAFVPDPKDGFNGYKGRKGVFEAILMDKNIEEVIKNGGGAREVKEAAKPQGILDIYQDAVIKVLHGTTSLQEVERVIGLNLDA